MNQTNRTEPNSVYSECIRKNASFIVIIMRERRRRGMKSLIHEKFRRSTTLSHIETKRNFSIPTNTNSIIIFSSVFIFGHFLLSPSLFFSLSLSKKFFFVIASLSRICSCYIAVSLYRVCVCVCVRLCVLFFYNFFGSINVYT